MVGVAVAASALGAAAGMLCAPTSGPEMRRRLRRRLDEESGLLLRKGHRAMEDAADYLNGQFHEQARRLRRAMTA
jgi:gas vesicle protein